MKKVAKNLKIPQRSGSFVRDGIVCKKKDIDCDNLMHR